MPLNHCSSHHRPQLFLLDLLTSHHNREYVAPLSPCSRHNQPQAKGEANHSGARPVQWLSYVMPGPASWREGAGAVWLTWRRENFSENRLASFSVKTICSRSP
jgi:hypothetical protein